MSTIELQLELEAQLLQKTKDRFHEGNEKAAQQGRGHETDHARRLYKQFITDLTDDLQELIAYGKSRPGPGGKYYKLVERIEPELACGIGLNEMFDNVFAGKSGMQDSLIKIGMRIEDDIKFTKFKTEHPDYFDVVIRDFKTKGTTNYRHMHRVLTNKMHEFDVEWNDWTSLERIKVGEVVANVIIDTTGLFKIKKAVQRGKKSDPVTLEFTDDTEEWLGKFSEYAQFLRPLGAPTIVPPKPWENMNHGGFYSPEMQSKFPFVRTRHQKHLVGADFSRHMQAVNRLQETAWSINPQVRHFFQWAMQNNITSMIGLPASQPHEFPTSPYPSMDKDDMTEAQAEEFLMWKRETAALHTKERKRHADALSLWRISTMAEDYKLYDKFYFVYTTDFRGRIYPVTSGLSPQGADYSKGLLRFSEGKELGTEGAFWFTVHGANLLGYDKDSYEGRVRYINERELTDKIRRVGDDPYSIETAKFIGTADKPLQFLAWCLEYCDYLRDGIQFVSHLPVGLDGSCNGLQNFSAVLRDEVGGLATNVLPSSKPNDIYGEVANVTIRKLNAVDPEYKDVARKLLTQGINRKTTKRSVMTLPYGLSKHSSGQYIGDWLYENFQVEYQTYTEFNKAKNLLNDCVWDAIGEVVQAARQGMAWLQDIARVAGKESKGLVWTTPTGFRVYQFDCKSKTRRIRSALEGVCEFVIREFTDKIDTSALKNGSAPNYIHSMDASHLVLTVLESEGITSWQMVHDDFGSHASDIPELHRAIRVSFYRMYNNIDRLAMFADEVGSNLEADLPEQPSMGNMNVADVLESEYFFG